MKDPKHTAEEYLTNNMSKSWLSNERPDEWLFTPGQLMTAFSAGAHWMLEEILKELRSDPPYGGGGSGHPLANAADWLANRFENKE